MCFSQNGGRAVICGHVGRGGRARGAPRDVREPVLCSAREEGHSGKKCHCDGFDAVSKAPKEPKEPNRYREKCLRPHVRRHAPPQTPCELETRCQIVHLREKCLERGQEVLKCQPSTAGVRPKVHWPHKRHLHSSVV